MIPLYNEEETLEVLGKCLQKLHSRLSGAFKVSYLFVDDGSKDSTFSRIECAVPPGAMYDIYRHAENRGIGAAFRTAFLHADADVVCTIDGDCSYPPSDLFAMILSVLSGDADIVVASPYHPKGGVQGVQRWRCALSFGCSRLYRIFTPLRLYTYTSIFRAYRGSIVKDLRSSREDFVAAVELLLSASSMGCKIDEAPLVLQRRTTGVSKMRIAQTVRGHLWLLSQCIRGRGYPAALRVDKQLSRSESKKPAYAKPVQPWERVAATKYSADSAAATKGAAL